jgi:hypothetical protein
MMPRRSPNFMEHIHYFGNSRIIEPSDYKNNNTKVEIICDKGHTYKLSVNQIKNQGKDPNVCPHCKKQSIYYQSGIPESVIKKYALENDVDYEPKKDYYNRWNDTITFTSKKSGYTCEVRSLGHWEKTQPCFIHHYDPIKTKEVERKFQSIRENYNDTNIVTLPISKFNKKPTPKVLQIIENSTWHIIEYNGTREKSKFICTNCGYQKSTYIHNLNGKGAKCINCTKKQQKCSVTDKLIEICKINHLLLPDDFIYRNVDSNIDFTCNLCGNKFKKSWAEITGLYYKLKCPKCSSKNKAIKEKELYEFVSSIEPTIANDRNHISPLEIDCLLKNKKYAFEFCGNIWHSTKYNKDNNYHKNKMIACENKGTQLFTIFEDEWDDSKDICKSRIKNILGKTSNKVYARNCIVKESSKVEAKEFLDKTHIQGRCNFDIALSLYNNDNQISVMCFRKHSNRKYDWELVRFSSELDTLVVGGASKLLKSFCNNHNGTIVSFADMRWSTGKVYEKIGFVLDGVIPPRFSYVGSKTNWKRKHRFTYNKKRLVKIFDESSEATEVTISEKNGLYRLYDCGYKRYILNIDK